jgi:hypothetical protein
LAPETLAVDYLYTYWVPKGFKIDRYTSLPEGEAKAWGGAGSLPAPKEIGTVTGGSLTTPSATNKDLNTLLTGITKVAFTVYGTSGIKSVPLSNTLVLQVRMSN